MTFKATLWREHKVFGELVEILVGSSSRLETSIRLEAVAERLQPAFVWGWMFLEAHELKLSTMTIEFMADLYINYLASLLVGTLLLVCGLD